jgi:hypothetical protein
MTVTGHKSENSLKTYTGYTGDAIKKSMSNTISKTLRKSTNETCIQDDQSNIVFEDWYNGAIVQPFQIG